eukprot:7378271-Prorocentrum_lima.AAC.1
MHTEYDLKGGYDIKTPLWFCGYCPHARSIKSSTSKAIDHLSSAHGLVDPKKRKRQAMKEEEDAERKRLRAVSGQQGSSRSLILSYALAVIDQFWTFASADAKR